MPTLILNTSEHPCADCGAHTRHPHDYGCNIYRGDRERERSSFERVVELRAAFPNLFAEPVDPKNATPAIAEVAPTEPSQSEPERSTDSAQADRITAADRDRINARVNRDGSVSWTQHVYPAPGVTLVPGMPPGTMLITSQNSHVLVHNIAEPPPMTPPVLVAQVLSQPLVAAGGYSIGCTIGGEPPPPRAPADASPTEAWEHAATGENDQRVFDLTQIPVTERHDLGNGHVLLIRAAPAGEPRVDFAFFESHSEWATDDGAIERRHSMVFHGYGYAGALRECRHVWFGEDPHAPDGYLFYAPLKAMAAAFAVLGTFFDLD